MRLISLSGLSGSGKSVALHMLEDLDFYCVDNIPAALLKPFISHTVRSSSTVYQRTAIGIDARNPGDEIATVPMLLDELKRSGIQCELVFLVASDEELLRRFGRRPRDRMSVLVESFGFKHGIPGDADFVFDARSLPNPYWEPTLRPLTGRDDAVIHFLQAQPTVTRF